MIIFFQRIRLVGFYFGASEVANFVWQISRILLLISLLITASCAGQDADNSALYDHPGTIIKQPPYFEKRVNPKAYYNPYEFNQSNPSDIDSSYVPPTYNNINENYGDIPRSGRDRMY